MLKFDLSARAARSYELLGTCNKLYHELVRLQLIDTQGNKI